MISETFTPIEPTLGDNAGWTDIRPLGSHVFRATRSGKYFILKTARDTSTEALALLKREYDLGCRLLHPYLVSTLGYEADSPVGPAIVMEYVEGTTLREALTEKLSRKQREQIFGQLLEAVAAIHRAGVIHNDLKPENILLTAVDGNVKLLDFGLSETPAHFMTRSLGGTRSYASPELRAGKAVDARSDIWSLGVLLQELFGRRYGHIARKCRHEEPAKRYPDIAALRRAWDHRKRMVHILLSSLVLVLLFGGIGFAWARIDRTARGIAEEKNAVEDRYSEVQAALDGYYFSALDTLDQLPYQDFGAMVVANFAMNAFKYRAAMQEWPLEPSILSELSARAQALSEQRYMELLQYQQAMPSVSSLPEAEQMAIYTEMSSDAWYYKKVLERTHQ